MSRWHLEGFIDNSSRKSRMALTSLPFIVGRLDGLSMTLHSGEISRRHAQFTAGGDGLVLQDMGSTNGTFVNRARIEEPTGIKDGDIVHFGSLEFRVVDEVAEFSREQQSDEEMTMLKPATLTQRLAMGTRELREALDRNLVTAVFQPIVEKGGTLFALEALGRGAHPALSPSPLHLFQIAEDIGLSVALSKAFRHAAVSLAAAAGVQVPLYLNTHPDEVNHTAALLDDFRLLRHRFPDVPLVMEMHEGAVTDVGAMKELQQELRLLSIGLAYDDFGAGQARLLELAHATPDVVKFDIAFVRGIDKAPPQQVALVRALASMVQQMGIRSLAEGVGEEPEARICENLPFDLFQGYHYARPDTLDKLRPRGLA